MSFTVTVFNSYGTLVSENTFKENSTAWGFAETKRPPCGASYVHVEPLTFGKPYRLSSPMLRPPCPKPRRLSASQIEAAAKRFEADGEYENAASMRALAS